MVLRFWWHVLLFTTFSSSAIASDALARKIAQSHCKTKIRDFADKVAKLKFWYSIADSEKDVETFKASERATGNITIIRFTKNGTVFVIKRSSSTIQKIEWSPFTATGCQQKISEENVSAYRWSSTGFYDDDLRKVLEEKQTGMIIVWSPGMPFSIRAISEAQKAADLTGHKLIRVVDPKFSDSEILGALSIERVPSGKDLRLRSENLFGRNVTFHYPTLIVFKDGQLSNHMLKGYKSASSYLKFIREEVQYLQR